MNDKKTVIFDLDGTLCVTNKHMDGYWEYKAAQPFPDRISRVNQLFDSGNRIIIETARGSNSREDWTNFTKEQICDMAESQVNKWLKNIEIK